MARKGETTLWRTDVLAVVITDGELRVRLVSVT